MARIWRYVLAADSGMAPCPQDGTLSLCTCKPLIRRSAEPGDWVIGFLPKRMGIGKVAWAGRVSQNPSLGDYQEKHPKRADAVYRRIGISTEGREILEPLREDYHPEPENRAKDARGRNALIFDPFWYWGGAAVQAPPAVAEMAHYFVGQTTKNSSTERVHMLESWLRGVSEPGTHGEPRDGPSTLEWAPGPSRRSRPANGSKRANRRRSC